MSEEGGELHVSEEFGKAKRYLLWSCCIAILLWMVQADHGAVESPMLGSSAKIGVEWLRGGVWLACLYFLIGFIRQVRNVERINSQMLYASELANMFSRLERVAAQYDDLGDTAQDIALRMLPKGAHPGAKKFADDIEGVVRGVVDQIELPPSGITVTEARQRLRAQAESIVRALRPGIRSCVNDLLFNAIYKKEEPESVSRGGEEAPTPIEIMFEARNASRHIFRLGGQFTRLSASILTDHVLMFQLYDKMLGYVMFFLATVACAWTPLGWVAHNVLPVALPEFFRWSAVILGLAAVPLGFLIAARVRRRWEDSEERRSRIMIWYDDIPYERRLNQTLLNALPPRKR